MAVSTNNSCFSFATPQHWRVIFPVDCNIFQLYGYGLQNIVYLSLKHTGHLSKSGTI